MFGKFLKVQIFLFFITKSFGITTITADNPNFQYTGRIDFSKPTEPVIYWPGSYIKANFEGSLLIISLNDETGESYYDVFVDNNYDTPYIINCNAGSSSYLISASLKDTVHSLLIFRRTEASTGPTKFLGIQLLEGKTLLEPPIRPKHKILFYGNSITCGMGNEAPDDGVDNNMSQENNFLAYGAITSRLVNADYMCIAKSGIGIMISWFDMVMSDYYYRLNPDDTESQWNFNEYIPDVVVINLFQNDSWLIGNLSPTPDSTDIINAYIDFLHLIRNHHQEAFIICSLGSMDATQTGSPWPDYIENAVSYLKTQENDTNIGTLFFPFDPIWTKHPRIRHHQIMADTLSTYINQIMDWNTTSISNNFFSKSPDNFRLLQNYPNPFNPSTTIEYTIEQPSNVKIIVYDILGREVQTITDEFKEPGSYKENFIGLNLCSGVYYYQLISNNKTQTRSMLLLK